MLLRYWHTLRHLRAVQFYGRLWFRLYRPRPDRRPAPGLRGATGARVAPAGRSPAMLGPDTFRFLNQTHQVRGPTGWNDPAREKLWLYNLHYFDDLNAADAAARAEWHRALLPRWVAENPPGTGNGWEPYPTSLRIVNWIKWALAGHALPPECVQSLAVQTRWLRRRLEHHLLGNHLFANAKALAFAGAFFVGPEADRWRECGRVILVREVREQMLADGGHFERSPMYHAILLEDLLDLIGLGEVYPGVLDADMLAECRDCARRMGVWLATMCHPDGEIAFFNDAARGIAPTPSELFGLGERLGLGLAPDASAGRGPRVIWLRDSGYVRLDVGPAVALLDLAPIGPDYLPGHAHADTLSFELSLFGQRVIVNGGTSRYGSGPERLAERGTAAHSTVEVDGADSSEVWGGFRVARRARPVDVRVERVQDPVDDRLRGRDLRVGTPSESGSPAAEAVRVSAAHDGYRRLRGRPVHRRYWEMTPDRLTVTDRLEGAYGKALARFHLHPEVQADGEGSQGCLVLAGGECVRWSVSRGRARLVPGVWHPEFGRSVPTRCLEVEIAGGACEVVFEWGRRVTSHDGVRLESEPLESEPLESREREG